MCANQTLDEAIERLIYVGMGTKDVATDEIRKALKVFVEAACERP